MNSNLKRKDIFSLYLLIVLAIVLPVIGYQTYFSMKAAPLTPPLTPPITIIPTINPPTIIPSFLPDLVISKPIIVSPNPVTIGKTVKISFKLTNLGTTTAKPAQYSYTNQAGGYSRIDPSNTCVGSTVLRPKESCISAYLFTFSTVGQKTMSIKLDPSNLVKESNESNNDYLVRLTVLSIPTPVINQIKVVSPNGGEILYVGQTSKITWNSSPNIDRVSISYALQNGTRVIIANNIPNNKIYLWKTYLGDFAPSKALVKIFITGYQSNGPLVTDASDNYFTVIRPFITPTLAPTRMPTPTNAPTPMSYQLRILTPNGGEVLGKGTSYPITWNSTKNFSSIDIYYGTEGGFAGRIVSDLTSDSGFYLWRVNPIFGAGKYKIFINGNNDGYNYANDSSDSYFIVQ